MKQDKKKLEINNSLLKNTDVCKMIIERSSEGLALFDNEFNFSYANQSCGEIFGVDPGKLNGNNLSRYAIKTDYLKFLNNKSSFIYTSRFEYEIEIKKPEKQNRWLFMTLTPIRYQDGFSGFLGNFRDISERKKIENELNYRLEFERIIAGLSTDFVRLHSDEVDKGINHALRSIGQFVEADRSYVFLLSNDMSSMIKTHNWNAEGIELTLPRLSSFPADLFPWMMEKLKKFKIIHVPRVADLPNQAINEKTEFDKRDVKSLIIVPMVSGDTLMGFVGFDSVKTEKGWSSKIIALLRIIGELCANVIARQQAEYALRESEDRYRDLVEHSQDLICTHTLDGTILSVNEGSARSLEYIPDALTGMNIRDIIVPEYRKDFKKYLKQIKKNGRVYGFVQVITRTGKRKVWQYDNTLRTEGIDTPIVRGMAHDVTHRIHAEKALQASEEKYRTLAEASQQGIAIYQNGKIVFANEALATSLGYTVKKLLSFSSKKVTELIVLDDRVVIDKISQNKSTHKEIPTNIEIRVICKDGSIRWFQVFMVNIIYNRKPASLATTLDITQRKQAEDRLRASLSEKEALLKEIHHRVKNNMQVISSLLSLQSRTISDNAIRDMFKESQNRIRAMALVHETLYRTEDFSRIDLNIYIKELAGRLYRAYSKDTARVGLSIDSEKVFLPVDRALPLGLIINELVSNSLKHAFPDKDQKQCQIKISMRLTKNQQMELKVTDNGIGLPEEIDLKKTKSMGLYLVKILTEEQLHGDISFKRNKGTTFIIRLPDNVSK